MTLIGLPVYNSKKEFKGTVTDRHHEGDADVIALTMTGKSKCRTLKECYGHLSLTTEASTSA